MNTEDKDDMKTMVIITIVVSVLALVGKQVYNHFNPTREEQAQKAALKLQKAFKEKMQDAIIQAAEDLEQETQANKSKNEKTIVQETREHAIMETRRANGRQVVPESLQTKREQPIVEPKGVDQVKTSLKQDSQVESTVAGVTVFGITIGKTTGKEIREQFSVIQETDSSHIVAGSQLLVLNAKDFFSEKFPVNFIGVSVNQNGVVVECLIEFSGKYFKELNKILSQKYKLKCKEDPFVGNRSALYVENDVNIKLAEPHMNHITHLIYVNKKWDALCRDYDKKQAEQENKRIANQF